MGNAEGIHGKPVQGDLAGMLWQISRVRNGQYRFRISLVGDSQLYQPLSEHRIRELSYRGEPDRTPDPGISCDRICLLSGQAGIEDLAGRTKQILVLEQIIAFDKISQQEDKGVECRDQRGCKCQDTVLDAVRPEVAPDQGAADRQVVICKHGRFSLFTDMAVLDTDHPVSHLCDLQIVRDHH